MNRHVPAAPRMSQARKSLPIMPGCSMEWEQFDAIAETSQFADHLARSHLLRFGVDERPSLLVAHALVQDLPDQSTQPVGDGANRLGMPEARDDPTIHDGKDRPFGLHGGVGGLIEDAPHLAVAFGAAVAVVHTRTLLIAGASAHPGGEMLR